jgi:hypothetical protein
MLTMLEALMLSKLFIIVDGWLAVGCWLCIPLTIFIFLNS